MSFYIAIVGVIYVVCSHKTFLQAKDTLRFYKECWKVSKEDGMICTLDVLLNVSFVLLSWFFMYQYFKK